MNEYVSAFPFVKTELKQLINMFLDLGFIPTLLWYIFKMFEG
jgi:hypothetical protein